MRKTARDGLLGLATAFLATSVVGTAGAGPTHTVSWGGPDLAYAGPDWPAGPGTDYNSSGFAIQKNDGTITGQWQDNAFNPDVGSIVHLHARVVCLSVQGNEAWVLGKLTSPWIPEGWYMIEGFRDVGQSSGDDPDEATFLFFIEEANESDCSESTAYNAGWDGNWYPYTKGQVKVR